MSSIPDISSHSPRSIATPTLCSLPRWLPSADDRVIRLTEFFPRHTLNRDLGVPGTTPSVPSNGMGIPHVYYRCFGDCILRKLPVEVPILMCCIIFLLCWDTIQWLPDGILSLEVTCVFAFQTQEFFSPDFTQVISLFP